jgi:hypothetical protein
MSLGISGPTITLFFRSLATSTRQQKHSTIRWRRLDLSWQTDRHLHIGYVQYQLQSVGVDKTTRRLVCGSGPRPARQCLWTPAAITELKWAYTMSGELDTDSHETIAPDGSSSGTIAYTKNGVVTAGPMPYLDSRTPPTSHLYSSVTVPTSSGWPRRGYCGPRGLRLRKALRGGCLL